MEDSIEKIKELEIEYKDTSDKLNAITNKMRSIVNSMDLSNRCFSVYKTDNYEVLIKLTNRVKHESVEEGTTIDFPNLEYSAIKVSKYINENGTFEYKISNEVEYIYPDKIINEITEEEFVSYFTNAIQEISNILD